MPKIPLYCIGDTANKYDNGNYLYGWHGNREGSTMLFVSGTVRIFQAIKEKVQSPAVKPKLIYNGIWCVYMQGPAAYPCSGIPK